MCFHMHLKRPDLTSLFYMQISTDIISIYKDQITCCFAVGFGNALLMLSLLGIKRGLQDLGIWLMEILQHISIS